MLPGQGLEATPGIEPDQQAFCGYWLILARVATSTNMQVTGHILARARPSGVARSRPVLKFL